MLSSPGIALGRPNEEMKQGWDVIMGHRIALGRPKEDKQRLGAEKYGALSLSSDAEDVNPT